MSKRTKLGLAGLVLLGAASIFSPKISADENKPAVILDNFDYASHRNVPAIDGKCYEGTIFNYNLLSDATIAQSDKKGVVIEPIWFYDIDNDGKFGKAEMDAIKAGIPIFMHQEFNDIANSKIRQYLEKSYNSKGQSDANASDIIDEQAGRYDEQVKKIIEEILNQYQDKQAQKETSQKEISGTNQVPVNLIFEGNSNADFNSFGGSLGVRINPFKDKNLGLAALLDVGFGLDKQTDSTSLTYLDSVFNSDVTMSGVKNNSNNFSVGGSLEISYGPLVLGGGASYNSWIENTNEEISLGDILLKSNSVSVPNSTISGKVYGGLEIPIGKNYTIGAVGGYDSLNKFFFGLRNTIRLNPSKE